MTEKLTDEGVLLVGLLTVFLCRAVIAFTIVPPYQGPDEPGQFAVAYGLSMPSSAQPQIDAGVLRSMVRHRWFELYDDPPPDPLPPSYESIPGISAGLLIQPLYYGLGAAVLRVSRPVDLDTAYVHLRVHSLVLAVVTLAMGWAGTRLLFGPEIAFGASAIAAMHPQFLLASTSVNADALLNLLGAFVWWQAARALTGCRRGLSIVLMFVGAIAALFTKRVGMVLIGLAFVVAVASAFAGRTSRRTRLGAAVIGSIVIVGVAYLVAGPYSERVAEFFPLHWRRSFRVIRLPENATAGEGLRFARMTLDYFWLIAGWLRFQPPVAWLWIARILVVGGLAGAAVALVASRTARPPLAIAWLFVATQVIAMFIAVFWTVSVAPQARYLFPVFIPITVLLYVGLQRAVPAAFRRHAPAFLIVIFALMDVTGFATVHIPSYIR